LDEAADAAPANAAFASGNYFDVLRAPMALGRAFSAADDVTGAAAVTVLSHALWTARYGADPNIVGRTISIDGVDFTVVGVASRNFEGTGGRMDLWIPLSALAVARPGDANVEAILTSPTYCCSEVAGRLADGATPEQARAELGVLFRQISPPELFAQFRQFAPDVGAESLSIALSGTAMLARPDRIARAAAIVLLLFAAVVSVLLLSCANVSNLLLARAAARQREIAVRLAIGAARRRVLRQLLTESVLLSAVACAISVLLAYVLPDLIFRLIGQDVPGGLHLAPDLSVLAYCTAVGLLSAVTFGIAPALRGTDVAVIDAMKRHAQHASPRFPLRGVLLGTQVAVSVTLLIGASLLLRGLDRAQSADPGFRTDGITALNVRLPVNEYDAARLGAFFADVLARLRGQGAREPIGATGRAPLADGSNWAGVRAAGQSDFESAIWHTVSAEFFDVLGIPIVAGRGFSPNDRPGEVIVVNETLARRYWPEQNAVGQTLAVGDTPAEVVGVVRDAELNTLGPPEPTFFVPFVGAATSALLVPEALAPQVTAIVQLAEPRAIVTPVPLADRFRAALGDSLGAARIASALGLLALLLTAVGVYGVIAYSVERSRKEIGVRLALGARAGEVIAMVLRRNSKAVLGGICVGVLVAAGASAILQAEFYGVEPLDPLTYAGVLALIVAACAAASAIPALRATQTDPANVLHHE
jgi:predicted permease